MDPQECLKQWARGVADGDMDSAGEAAGDYNGWIKRGGFKATYKGHPVIGLYPDACAYDDGSGLFSYASPSDVLTDRT